MPKTAKTAKSRKPSKPTINYSDMLVAEQPPGDLAKEVGRVAQQLSDLTHLDRIADNLGGIETALRSAADAMALSTIAQHGSPDERKKAVEHLMNWFEDFRC